MKYGNVALLCLTIFLLNGCAESPIDAKKVGSTQASSHNVGNSAELQLTDKDIFGNETTLAVSEEDIQAALDSEKLSVPLHSSVILVQSGNRAPELSMQKEMSRYYTVATFSGIPDRQKPMSCNTKVQDTPINENMNYMQALRYIAAKGRQKTIVVYWEALQSGHYDVTTKSTQWSDYKSDKMADASSLRYLIRFALVDVASGEWASWSPGNDEYIVPASQPSKPETTEQQLVQLKQKTYAAAVKDLTTRFE
ncbi:MAG TPA: hypothetical protein VH187_23105 [Scandinavium sp.]|jgi:hypothetical protein|uniref:hypothetical protein n=1 Tax=Scandinavium sp. TaxID=2830653 RepID=UPI002E33EBC7|nr:hypothetical protein [Scandinavium sp.]HEX4504018.1 hypothetical protein [Scandinavium sp.]